MDDDELEVELETLIELRARLSADIERLRNKIKNRDRPKSLREAYGANYGGWWVATACLSPHVQTWCNSGHSPAMLAELVGVSAKTIYNIRDGTTEWTRDETAEAIMTKLGLTHVYADFEQVRLTRKYRAAPAEPPPSHYFEE